MVQLGIDANGWRRFYCPVCGHVEWVAPGEQLPQHYTCPLCGVGHKSMIAFDDPRLARHEVLFEEVAPGVIMTDKRPPFRADFEHHSYILKHPQGLILYDAPPFINDEAVEAVRALGRPRLLIVSHLDFVGLASDWAQALGVPAWMGAGDDPLPGNRFVPTHRINESVELEPGLEVVRVPGHSDGSLAIYWSDAPAGPALFSGDAITVWRHEDNRVQVTFFQTAPAGEEIKELASRPVWLLASCGGYLKEAGGPLKRLLSTPENCARPYRGETGGVWLEPGEA
jgi:glyoxylase-like metal-dependent hydrolase (beta-lactamase superfamily II)/rubredoxin